MKMKVLLLVALSFSLAFGVVYASSINGEYNGRPIVKVTHGGQELGVEDVPAVVLDGRTMVPVRMIEQLGLDVEWFGDTYTVDIKSSVVDVKKIIRELGDSSVRSIQYSVNDIGEDTLSADLSFSVLGEWNEYQENTYSNLLLKAVETQVDYFSVTGSDSTKVVIKIQDLLDYSNGLISDEELENRTKYLNVSETSVTFIEQTDEVTDEDEFGSKREILNYLEENYSTLETSIGTANFNITVDENNVRIHPQDYWIKMYDEDFFFELRFSNKINSLQREKVKQELKDFQEKLGKDLIARYPDKKFIGGFYDSFFRYPNIRVDLVVSRFYTWTNYSNTLSVDAYENTKPSTFRWYSDLDNDF